MSPEGYRFRAAEFAAKARSEINPTKRAEYDALRVSYLRRADLAERNAGTDIVYETPREQPHVQQQMQPTQDK